VGRSRTGISLGDWSRVFKADGRAEDGGREKSGYERLRHWSGWGKSGTGWVWGCGCVGLGGPGGGLVGYGPALRPRTIPGEFSIKSKEARIKNKFQSSPATSRCTESLMKMERITNTSYPHMYLPG